MDKAVRDKKHANFLSLRFTWRLYEFLLDEQGFTSCERVAAVLNALNIRGDRIDERMGPDRRVSRQTVHRALQKTTEGQVLLNRTKQERMSGV